MATSTSQTPAHRLVLEGQPIGAVLTITGVDGDHDRTKRLMALGLRVGEQVEVTNTRAKGVIISSDTGRVAVGPELARHIQVEEVAS